MNKLDEIISNKFDQVEHSVPESAWGYVAANIPKYTRKKRATIFLFASLIFLAILYILTLRFNDTPITNQSFKINDTSAQSNTTSKSETIQTSNIEMQLEMSKSVGQNIVKNNTQKSSIHIKPSSAKIEKNIQSLTNSVDYNNNKLTGNSFFISQTHKFIQIKQIYTPVQKIEHQKNLQYSEFKTSFPDPKIPLVCDLKSKNSSTAIGLYFGADLPFSQRGIVPDDEGQQSYISARNDTESAIVSFHAGARIQHDVHENIFVRFGLDYSLINERFQLVDSGATRIQTVIDSIFAPDGTLIDVQFTTSTVSGIREVNHYNQIKSFTVPISLGYQKRRERLSWFVNAGLAFTLSSSYDGKILSPGLNGVIISSGSSAELIPYKTNFGLNLIGGFGIAKPLNDKIDFLVESRFRYILNSISNNSYPIDQKYFTIGISTGVNYKF